MFSTLSSFFEKSGGNYNTQPEVKIWLKDFAISSPNLM